MKLPVEICEQRFNSLLKQGSVFYTREYQFRDGIKGRKFIIFLSRSTHSQRLLFILPTSQVSPYYKKYACRPYVKVKPDCSKLFHKDTILDLSKIIKGSRERFLEMFSERKLYYKGFLEEDLMDKIFDCIRNADVITERTKREILPLSWQRQEKCVH